MLLRLAHVRRQWRQERQSKLLEKGSFSIKYEPLRLGRNAPGGGLFARPLALVLDLRERDQPFNDDGERVAPRILRRHSVNSSRDAWRAGDHNALAQTTFRPHSRMALAAAARSPRPQQAQPPGSAATPAPSRPSPAAARALETATPQETADRPAAALSAPRPEEVERISDPRSRSRPDCDAAIPRDRGIVRDCAPHPCRQRPPRPSRWRQGDPAWLRGPQTGLATRRLRGSRRDRRASSPVRPIRWRRPPRVRQPTVRWRQRFVRGRGLPGAARMSATHSPRATAPAEQGLRERRGE